MRHILLCVVSNMELSENLGRGDQLLDNLYISNDHYTIKNLAANWGIEHIGELLLHEILTATAIIYSNCDVVTDGDSASVYEYHETQIATHIDLFLSTLWFIKDHCCSVDFMFVLRGEDQMAFLRPNRGSRFFANGDISQTRFSRTDLKKARNIFWSYSLKPGQEYNHGATSIRKHISNSITRAFAHIHAANLAYDVAFKIASYCSALEALFLTDKGELSHQLAERVAFFLEDEPKERRKLFYKIKDAYNFRSSAVHGSGIKHTDEDIKFMAVSCDNILRRVTTRILGDVDLQKFFCNDSELNEFFINKIIGSKQS